MSEKRKEKKKERYKIQIEKPSKFYGGKCLKLNELDLIKTDQYF